MEITGVVGNDDGVNIEQELQIQTAIPSSEDDLDLDINNNKGIVEMSQKTKSTASDGRKVTIRRRSVENHRL